MSFQVRSWPVGASAPETSTEAGVAARPPDAAVLAAASSTGGWSGRWLREPLVHFVAIGALFFAASQLLSANGDPRDRSARIALTEDDLRQMSVAWLAQGRPAPTPEQMRSLVESRVREEVLYREALALGLDRDDAVVKRRLAQKMEFLAEDVSSLREPAPGELHSWFEQHSGRFALSPRASFRHLYFSPDRRGPRASDDAARVLAALAGKPADWPGAAMLADPFMFQDHYGDRPADQLASVFGPAFARAVVELAPGAWRGPIESGYGWHLVRVDSITAGRIPAFEEIEADVKAEWVAAQRALAKRTAFEAMRARYDVVLPAAVASTPLAGLPAARPNR